MSAPVVSMLVMVPPMPFSAWDFRASVASECAIVAFMAWITSFLPAGEEYPTHELLSREPHCADRESASRQTRYGDSRELASSLRVTLRVQATQ